MEQRAISVGTIGIHCPNCYARTEQEVELIIRKGPYGKFIGCRNFPKCKYRQHLREYDK